jgi:hypothetical protein
MTMTKEEERAEAEMERSALYHSTIAALSAEQKRNFQNLNDMLHKIEETAVNEAKAGENSCDATMLCLAAMFLSRVVLTVSSRSTDCGHDGCVKRRAFVLLDATADAASLWAETATKVPPQKERH